MPEAEGVADIERPTRSSPTSKTFGRAIGCGHAIAVEPFGTAVNNADALIFRQAECAGCGSGWRQPHEHGHIVALGRTSEVIERQRLQVECAPSMTTTCCETRG